MGVADVRAWDEAPPNGHVIRFGTYVHAAMKKDRFKVMSVFH